ncbi:MAG TPA: AraC family transcriptional regulator ligand-binding domain-containing protein [Vicinamibacterales bacterium]|nr:AraC family transcriptional regulator ligand-binding domain-containing protein [Vicinamibacterales bacterium]
MAMRANSLTDRVKPPPAPAGSAPTAPASEFAAFANGLTRLGFDLPTLFAAAGVAGLDFSDPDARVPCEAYGRVVEAVQRLRASPNLALDLAQRTPVGAYPLLDYLVATSDSVGAGVHQLVRYFRIVGSPVVMTLEAEADPIRVQFNANAWPFAAEFSASLLVLHFRDETDGRFSAAEVAFRHVPNDLAAFERVLECPVRAGADWSGVSLPMEAWQLPLRRRDPVLRQVLETQANDVLARLPVRQGLAQDVQRALAKRVAGGDTRIDTVARELATSGRTLQRRLADEGVSYQELLDEARKEAAARYLRASALAIGEVAYLVGYSEPAPFHRAFKRWYGVTPEMFRKRRDS